MDYNSVVGRAKEARHSRQYLVSRISSSPSRWAYTYRIANFSVGGIDIDSMALFYSRWGGLALFVG